MEAKDFKYIKLIKDSEDSYTIEFTMSDGGAGLIDIDFNEQGDISYIDIETYTQTNMVDAFWDEINSMYGIIDFLNLKINTHILF